MGRIGLALLGIPLMAIGLVGWILPFIPGLPLFLLGLALTISWHPKGKAFTDRCTLRFHYLLFNIQQQFKRSEKKVSPSN